MPIRADLKPLYGPAWHAISQRIRFERAKGRCEACDRAHGAIVYALPGSGWLDPADVPRSQIDFLRPIKVVLTTAHLDHDPTHSEDGNLMALCQRCHLTYDFAHHQAQRRLTYRSRLALGDLFEGSYGLAGYPRNAA